MTEPNGIILTPEKFDSVRSDPHFTTFVQVGRMLNAIQFARAVLGEYKGDRTLLARRLKGRAVYILGGYLHEAVRLIESLWSRYKLDPAFNELHELVGPSKEKNFLKVFRDNGAFHLDHFETTKTSLDNLVLNEETELALHDGEYITNMYFAFADMLDLNFLIDQLRSNPRLSGLVDLTGKSDDDLADWILTILKDYSEKILTGGIKFFNELTYRLDFAKR
jgi:hypothetical protein